MDNQEEIIKENPTETSSNKIVCPYEKDGFCNHPSCIRMPGMECKLYYLQNKRR